MSGADDYNLSQIISYDDVDIWSLELPVEIALHRSALRTAEAILVSKIEHLTASILKNPFTMSNTGRLDPITVLSHGEPFLFIIWICGWRRRAREPVSRSEAAPCGRASRRWPVLVKCAAALLPRLFACDLVEPIGIEPMT